MPRSMYEGITESILDLIGNTPLLRLGKVTKGLPGHVLVKLENMNPSGSIKDRMALRMIREAEQAGRIRPGSTTLIESSSGNTGQALAFVGAVEGYNVKICLPQSTSVGERIRALERYGADLVYIPDEDPDADRMARDAGLHGATIEIPGRVWCLKQEQSNNHVYWTRQFSNPGNWKGQGEIGKEILRQTDGKVDVFIAAIGSGGTFLGVSKVLKESVPDVRCIAVQPTGWEGYEDPLSIDTKYVPGITGGNVEEIRDSGIADDVRYLGNKEVKAMAYRLSSEEGLNCGMSSAACISVALDEASKSEMEDKNIVTVLVDGGYRYVTDERFVT